MKYKIEPSSELYKALTALHEKGKICNQKALDFIEKYQGGDNYYQPIGVLWGGIDGIQLPEKPKGWRRAYSDGMYVPTKTMAKAAYQEMKNLPVVMQDELNQLVGFKPFRWNKGSGKIGFVKSAGIFFIEQDILIEIHERTPKYQPAEGMVEILESVFMELSNKAA